MLLEFKISNFRSFNETQALSMIAGADKALPDNLIDVPDSKFKALKASAIYGANASGKSNLISAMNILKQMVIKSATRLNERDPFFPGTLLTPFRLHSQTKNQPSTFELFAQIDDTKYFYKVSVNNHQVFEEELTAFVKKSSKPSTAFTRQWNPDTKSYKWKFGTLIEKSKDKVILKDYSKRPNCLALSRGGEMSIEPLRTFYLWFQEQLYVYTLTNYTYQLFLESFALIKENENYRQKILQLLKDADTGIENIKPNEVPVDVNKIPSKVLERMKADGVDPAKLKNLGVDVEHREVDTQLPQFFDLQNDESQGTQRLFALGVPILEALENGRCVVVDELEASLHPNLVRKLIELFQSPTVNQKGAQLIFTTHNVELLDSNLFRRDQIYLTEKNRDSATELYSLWDFEKTPRNTEAFRKNYLAGRYGGIPQFGSLFEDFKFDEKTNSPDKSSSESSE
jgi:AAA15 family ATPase/GTPase